MAESVEQMRARLRGLSPALAALPEDSLKATRERLKAALVSDSPNSLNVLNETNPYVSVADRFLAKNFGDQETTLKKLNEDYAEKGVTFKMFGDQIVGKKASDKKWYPQEQTGFPTSFREAAQDATDVAYDLGSAVPITLAGAAGSYFGPVAGGLAAGAAGAGTEYLRQKLGSVFGYHSPNTDAANVAISGTLNTLAPAMFGLGDSAKTLSNPIVKKATGGLSEKLVEKKLVKNLENFGHGLAGEVEGGQVVRRAMTNPEKAVASEVWSESNRGLIPSGLDYLKEMLGGVPKASAKNAMKVAPETLKKTLLESGYKFDPAKPLRLFELSDILQNQPGDLPQGVSGNVWNVLNSTVENKSQEFSEALEGIHTQMAEKGKGGIPMAKVVADIEGLTTHLKNPPKTKILPKPSEGASPEDVVKYEIDRVSKTGLTPSEQKDIGFTQWMKENFLKAGDVKVGEKTLPDGTIEDVMQPVYIDQISPMRAMSIRDSLEHIKAGKSKEFGNIADKNMAKQIGAAAKSLDEKIYQSIDEASGFTGDQSLKKQWKSIQDLKRGLQQYFGTPDVGFRSIERYFNPAQRNLRRVINQADDTLGTNLKDLAELANVQKLFGDPAKNAINVGGQSVTQQGAKSAAWGHLAGSLIGGGVGAAAGAALGPEEGRWAEGKGTYLGGLSGAALGGLMFSPYMLKKSMRTKTPVLNFVEPNVEKMKNLYSEKTPEWIRNALGLAGNTAVPQSIPTAVRLNQQRGE